MAEYSEYSFMFIFISVGLIIILPLLLAGFGYGAPDAQLGIVGQVIYQGVKFVSEFIHVGITIVTNTLQYIIVSFLYIAESLLPAPLDQTVADLITDITAYFTALDEYFDSLFSEFYAFIITSLSIFSVIPTIINVMLFVPLGYVTVKAIFSR